MPPEDPGQCVEIFLDVTTRLGGKLLASGGWSPGMLLNILQCTEQRPPPAKNYKAEGVNDAKAETLLEALLI